jgi:predicted nuclease of predicted toxin-antitoxin system
VAASKLRLLLDESVPDPLARRILSMVPSAEYVRYIPGLKGALDRDIYAYAQRTNRIVVNVDGDFNERSFPPGPKNPGIIRFNSGRDDNAALFDQFKVFWQSGVRRFARNSVVFVTSREIRIVRQGGEALCIHVRKGKAKCRPTRG